MMYVLLIISYLMLSGLNQSIDNGLEIYQVKHSYPDFTQEEKPECYYCFEPTKDNLFDSALIDESDIEQFDWEEQQLILNKKGKKKIANLEIPLQGLPVTFVLNGEPIYGF